MTFSNAPRSLIIANQLARLIASGLLCSILIGCGNSALLGTDGPSASRIAHVNQHDAGLGIKLIDVTDTVAQRLMASNITPPFSASLGGSKPFGAMIGSGDVLDITIWEAPPAALFMTGALDLRTEGAGLGTGAQRSTGLPELMVNNAGVITVPFAGEIHAAGHSTQEIERAITARLSGKAHLPQVLVRTVRNTTSTVTIVGDVVNSTRMPLTAKGERLLDALATAGGVRQPVDKITLQVTRGDQVAAMPLATVIRDPHQNVYLQSGDVVTALYLSQSFTVLGATGKNDEVNFEAQGITLAQALGRIGGLRDDRANPNGVFIFRFENPAAIDLTTLANAKLTPNGKVPVIYRVNLHDPATFFVAQDFPLRDKDIIYVTNAPVADFQKFVNIIGSAIYPIGAVKNAGF